ncbi:hypothetical protein [Polyangium jinanense]|uniref:Uncharacterized protein n=1 Tax=Polyangium jinanense TaxID=2829994 RepID=A0A9X4ARK7_9BACT|nr:hypothetical protein [Polyangium jinanense]MDC3955596.1 hypothetical protein [Polyangium jinanense]MDC3982238.1 hypothetical protein [Polyangium jinanense]
MSTPKDPLLEAEAPDRVHYATGVLLDAADFVAEQSYHRGRLARALAYLHGFGTVAGLLVHHKPPVNGSAEELEVKPGIALDPLGRLVEVPRAACVRVKRWYEGHDEDVFNGSVVRTDGNYGIGPATGDPYLARGVVADVFLRFSSQPRGKTPALAAGPFDATDAVQPARMRDGYELRWVLRTENTVPPVPVAPWPLPEGGVPFTNPADPSDLVQRRRNVRDTILSSWHDNREAQLEAIRKDTFLPESMRKDPDTVDGDPDPAWILLARVVIGITAGQTETADDGTSRPLRNGTVFVDKEHRPFSLSAAALSWWLGF